MTYAMLLLMLTEAEARVRQYGAESDVGRRSQETVDLCKERMAREGITRDQLEALAAEAA